MNFEVTRSAVIYWSHRHDRLHVRVTRRSAVELCQGLMDFKARAFDG